MSLYSLDSLEAGECFSDNSKSFDFVTVRRHRSLDATVSLSGAALKAETHKLIEKPHGGETRNPLIASEASQAGSKCLSGRRSPDESLTTKRYQNASVTPISKDVVNSRDSTPKRISHRRGSTINENQSSSKTTVNSASTFKNDKKLTNVLTPPIIEEKTKPKTYLERYRERSGAKPTKKIIYSPEGSTLSIFGDTSYDTITEVDSRPPTTTPRDDQSELSFYRRFINHPRTTRSWDVEDRCMANTHFRSTSDYGTTTNSNKERISYRPYNVKDYESLTVPRADRSLGPDTFEIREKLEKLMRRTQYGDLASSRNRRNVVRRSELRKCKRTNVENQTVEFSLTEEHDVAGELADSKIKNFRNAQISHGIKKNQRLLRPKQMLTIGSLKHAKISTSSADCSTAGKKSTKSLILSLEENVGDSSLEDLQRRHQNEKRVMDLLINRTLLR